MGFLGCTWIHRRATTAGPAWLCALEAPLQRLFVRALAQGQGHLCPGTRGQLGPLRAPVGARPSDGGHRVNLPAEVAGVLDLGGRGPGVVVLEPEIVPPLAEGASELQREGADMALVVSVEHSLRDCLPRITREYPVVVEGRDEVIP